MTASKHKSARKAKSKNDKAHASLKKSKSRSSTPKRAWSGKRVLRRLISFITLVNMLYRALQCSEDSTSTVCTTLSQTMFAVQNNPYYELYAKDTLEPLAGVVQMIFHHVQDTTDPITRVLRTQRDAFDHAWIQPGRDLWYRHGDPWVKQSLPYSFLRQKQIALTKMLRPKEASIARWSKELHIRTHKLKRMANRIITY